MGKQLITTFYLNKRQTNSSSDAILLVTKDSEGKKEIQIIDNPEFSFYITKPEYRDDKIKNYIDIDKVEKITCKYKNLFSAMGEASKDKRIIDKINNAFKMSDVRKRLNEIHCEPIFHSTDMNIQDYYIDKFLEKNPYEENMYGLTKVFFDIEVDSTGIVGFPEQTRALCPINIISLVDMSTYTVYVLMLEYDTDTFNYCIDNISDVEEKLNEKYKIIEEKLNIKLKYEYFTFEHEADLIVAFFEFINEQIKPDFAVAWNTGFDFVYIYERIRRLGMEPNIICTPKDLPNKYKCAYYNLDERNSDPAEKSDSFVVTGYTIWLDLMCLYANLRKAMGKEESYTLDYIGEKETGFRKDDLEGTNIKTAHLDNYSQFLEYNIQDSVLLMLIEEKGNNLDALYSIAMLTRTRVEKALKKTICLRNYAALFYKAKNKVISNNHSSLKPSAGKIKGAFVADPDNIDNIGIKIVYDKSNRIFKYVVDFDLSALYPSIIITFNISPDTMFGKIKITNKFTKEDITDSFMDDYMCNDGIKFGQKYFSLPSIEDMYNYIKTNS